MSYKTIAVHLDDGPRCAARIALAADLARRFGGRLVGIAATGVPDVILSLNSAVADGIELVALSASHLRESAEASAQAFDAQCEVARHGPRVARGRRRAARRVDRARHASAT